MSELNKDDALDHRSNDEIDATPFILHASICHRGERGKIRKTFQRRATFKVDSSRSKRRCFDFKRFRSVGDRWLLFGRDIPTAAQTNSAFEENKTGNVVSNNQEISSQTAGDPR